MDRNRQGQYQYQGSEQAGREGRTSGDRGRNGQDGEHLERIVQFRISSQEYRMADILFSQHRKQFAWQTMSDMYRAMLKVGLKDIAKLVKEPTPAMLDAIRNHQELERVASMARRHTDLDCLLDQMDRDLDLTVRAGDLGAVRVMLEEFRKNTKEIKHDHMIRARREVEFDKRWGRLYESLNRGANLSFADSDEKDD